jgi:secreted PhoX family phosphatase
MKPVNYFLIAATGAFLTSAVQADLCPLPTISPNLTLNIPCLDLRNDQLNLGVQLEYAFPAELGMASEQNLYWKFAQFEDSACYGKSANCATLGQNLDITFPLELEDERYMAHLAYYPTPDQKGFYWRYVNHHINHLQFSPVKAPETDAEKRRILASESVLINGKTHAIGFHTILRSGTKVGDHVFGQLIDNQGQPLVAEDGTSVISNSNDFASLLPVGDKLFMVSHFESRPGAMYITELTQDENTGQLTAVSTKPADFSAVKGGWVHCAGSVTPWNSHLGSEEYEPDAEQRDPKTGSINDYYDAMGAYFGGDLLQMNPYDYGYIVEVKVLNEQGAHSVTKHYAMGRLAFELGYVLPDKKTAYMSDDGTNVGLYMFVADREMDLSSGTLYVARWEQVSSENGGRANLSWINLGHATSAEVKKYLDQGITFQDIFDKVEPTAAGVCSEGYSSINAGHEEDRYGNYHQCLKLKPGMEKAASRLETRRYAAMKGGTTELRKEEGITFNPVTNTLYVAISDIARGMEDNRKNGQENDKYDVGGFNHIRLPYNNCGGVYALDLVADDGIGSEYVAKNMYAIVTGNMTQAIDENSTIPAYDAEGPFANNACDLESIASPDNLTFIPAYQTLIIGEDTGSGHQNDMIWAYSLKTKELTRIQTTPYGSETTSPYIYADINGYGYLMSVVQHPFGESDVEQLNEAEEAFAYTGYIGPFPALK